MTTPPTPPTPPTRPTRSVDSLPETPSQTAGPYVHIGLVPRVAGLDVHPRQLGGDIAGSEAKGERIRIEGRVLDAAGAPVGDALIEVWQADADGRHVRSDAHRSRADGDVPTEPGFRGWGRVVPDLDTGLWYLDTVKPGPTSGPDGRMQAPHLMLWIVARGINLGLSTRVYFDDEAAANDRDPVLALVEAARRATLVARRDDGTGEGCADPSDRGGEGGVGNDLAGRGASDDVIRYRFDIRLQGEGETVFFDV